MSETDTWGRAIKAAFEAICRIDTRPEGKPRLSADQVLNEALLAVNNLRRRPGGWETYRAAFDDLPGLLAAERAKALRDAADDWDRAPEENRALLDRLAEDYRPGGPSMPAIWLRHRAERLGMTEGGEQIDLEGLLRAAFDAGVEAGDSGYIDNPDELDISFAVFLRHAANRATRSSS